MTPSWIELDRDNFKGKIIGIPRREELVQIPINEQLIVELYSGSTTRTKPRMGQALKSQFS